MPRKLKLLTNSIAIPAMFSCGSETFFCGIWKTIAFDLFTFNDSLLTLSQSFNQSINALYSGIFHPYTNYVITQLCDKKNKQTSMHVHIAHASNAGAMGKCIYDHCQQCSVGLNCMTSL